MAKNPKKTAAIFGTIGILHFAKPEKFDQIVPPKLPGSARFYTYASGVAELITAALLANKKTQKLGGAAMTALTLAVWPANFQMAYQWRKKAWPWQIVSLGRLPMQIPMIREGLAYARAK